MMESSIRGNNHNLLPPADLPGEIERLREDLSAERDRHLRTLADFKNYRRRIERDGNKLADEGKRGILLALLDTIDDVEKAMHLWNNALLRPAQVRVAG
ncbi:MAG: nucleotide exchange factor GrpE [Bacteroidota bacterium]